jgi:hypothetical protein
VRELRTFLDFCNAKFSKPKTLKPTRSSDTYSKMPQIHSKAKNVEIAQKLEYA